MCPKGEGTTIGGRIIRSGGRGFWNDCLLPPVKKVKRGQSGDAAEEKIGIS